MSNDTDKVIRTLIAVIFGLMVFYTIKNGIELHQTCKGTIVRNYWNQAECIDIKKIQE